MTKTIPARSSVCQLRWVGTSFQGTWAVMTLCLNPRSTPSPVLRVLQVTMLLPSEKQLSSLSTHWSPNSEYTMCPHAPEVVLGQRELCGRWRLNIRCVSFVTPCVTQELGMATWHTACLGPAYCPSSRQHLIFPHYRAV